MTQISTDLMELEPPSTVVSSVTHMMTLRPYQEQAKSIVLQKNVEGINKQVLVLATGLGKTVIFADIIRELIQKTGKKALILAHREELLNQAKDKLLSIDPTLSIGIEMAEQKSLPHNDVIVASVATIGRSNSNRLQKFDPKEFCIIVIDEAHHASAQTYKNVLKHFGILKNEKEIANFDNNAISHDWNKDCLLLGVTATPSRNDNEGIDKIFDEVVYNFGILEGIQDGWLSRIRAYRVNTTVELDNIHTVAGDFAQDELADAINNPERNDLVVKTYKEQFDDKQALVFAVDRAHAQALTDVFIDKKVPAAMVDGTTSKDLRKTILENFHKKSLKVVVNCMVLTEGYDNDTIDVIMMGRPTKSGILYSQMIGRGTRTHHEKPYLTICDFVDNTYRHTIKTAASLLGIEGKVDFRGKDILEAKEEIDKIRELAPTFDLNHLDFNKLAYVMEEVDLKSGLGIPHDLQDITQYAWYRFGEETYRINIGDSRYFRVYPTMTGQYEAVFEYWDIDSKKMITEYLGEENGLLAKERIIERVDSYIRNNYPEATRLIYMGARWRKEPITPSQIEQLQKLGVSNGMIATLANKGEAAQLQNKLYNQKRARHQWNYTQMKSRWR